MSTILGVYLHGSVHLTNPGPEELFLGILTDSLPQPVGPTRCPADLAMSQKDLTLPAETLGFAAERSALPQHELALPYKDVALPQKDMSGQIN